LRRIGEGRKEEERVREGRGGERKRTYERSPSSKFATTPLATYGRAGGMPETNT